MKGRTLRGRGRPGKPSRWRKSGRPQGPSSQGAGPSCRPARGPVFSGLLEAPLHPPASHFRGWGGEKPPEPKTTPPFLREDKRGVGL